MEVEASLRMASQKFGKRASLSLHAFQLGGDVRKLSLVFGTGPGQAPILVASLENPGAVLDALNAAVVYGRDEFSAQVNPDAPLDSPNGPAQLSYITSPWEELGLLCRSRRRTSCGHGRGTTNLFETVTTGTGTGQQTAGVGAFTGVQASEQGMVVTLVQARGGVTTQYMGFIPAGEQSVSGLASLDEGVAGEWEAQVG